MKTLAIKRGHCLIPLFVIATLFSTLIQADDFDLLMADLNGSKEKAQSKSTMDMGSQFEMEAQYKAAKALLKSKKYAEAAEALEVIVEKMSDDNPAKVGAACDLVQCYFYIGEYPKAKKYGTFVLGSKSKPEQKAEIYDYFKSFGMIGPTTWQYRWNMYYLHLAPDKDMEQIKKDYIPSLRELLKINPKDLKIRVELGYAEILEGDVDKGIAELESILKEPKLGNEIIADTYVGLAEGAFVIRCWTPPRSYRVGWRFRPVRRSVWRATT